MLGPYAYFLVQGEAFPDLSALIRAAEATSRRMKAGRWLKLAVRGMPWGGEDDARPRPTELLGGIEITPERVVFSEIDPFEG